MKARINEQNQIEIFSVLPDNWKNHINFKCADDALLQSEGFYDVYVPEYNAATEKLSDIYFDELFLIFTYDVINKTQAEIDYETAMIGWHHQDYCKRIIAPAALIDQYPNIGVHMWINKLPIEPSADGSLLYLYMNVIKHEHQALVDSLEGILVIEDMPVLE